MLSKNNKKNKVSFVPNAVGFCSLLFPLFWFSLICFAVEGFLEEKAVWTLKNNYSYNCLNFRGAQSINSVNKEKYCLHSSGPGPTIFLCIDECL